MPSDPLSTSMCGWLVGLVGLYPIFSGGEKKSKNSAFFRGKVAEYWSMAEDLERRCFSLLKLTF